MGQLRRLLLATLLALVPVTLAAQSSYFVGRGGYPIYFSSMPSAGFNPADGATVYIGSTLPFAPLSNESAAINALQRGVVRKAYCQWVNNGVSGSNENVSVYVRVGGATDYAITTSLQVTSAVNNFNNTNMSGAVAAGQAMTIKIVYPTWVTNPTAVTFFCEVWIEITY